MLHPYFSSLESLSWLSRRAAIPCRPCSCWSPICTPRRTQIVSAFSSPTWAGKNTLKVHLKHQFANGNPYVWMVWADLINQKCRFWLWTDGLVWKMLEKSAKSHHFRTVENRTRFWTQSLAWWREITFRILISQKFHVHGIVPYVHFPNEFRRKPPFVSMRFSSPSFPIAPHFAQETMRQAVKALVEAKADARRPFFFAWIRWGGVWGDLVIFWI